MTTTVADEDDPCKKIVTIMRDKCRNPRSSEEDDDANKAKMSFNELQGKTGMNRSYLIRVYRGEINPGLQNAVLIASALGYKLFIAKKDKSDG